MRQNKMNPSRFQIEMSEINKQMTQTNQMNYGNQRESNTIQTLWTNLLIIVATKPTVIFRRLKDRTLNLWNLFLSVPIRINCLKAIMPSLSRTLLISVWWMLDSMIKASQSLDTFAFFATRFSSSRTFWESISSRGTLTFWNRYFCS